MKHFKLIVGAFLVTVLFSSCAKDGADGAQGPPGTANVTTVTFASPAWSGTQINITVPQITDSIYNYGLVLPYMNFTNVNTVYYHVPGLVSNGSYLIRVYSQVGSMRFNAHNPDGSTATGTLPAVGKIKVVIIPAGTVTTGRVSSPQQAILNELAQAGVDVNSYDEVKRYYNLKD